MRTERTRPRPAGVGRTRSGLARLMVALLIGLGISLVVFGSLLASPYVRSRLWHWSAPRGQLLRAHPDLVSPSSAVSLDQPHPPAEASQDPAVSVEGTSAEPALPERLQIPSLGIDAPVVPVTWSTAWVDGRKVGVWDVPHGGAAGWHQDSALLGEVGNTVLNGHNTTGGEVFRDLYTLKVGDTLTIHSASEPYTYVVSETLVLPEAGQPWEVRMRNASLMEPTPNERVTLVTCHPYGSLRNRLIVIAVPAAKAPVE
ncbi:MAG: sortase [Chloroflexota bacterium]